MQNHPLNYISIISFSNTIQAIVMAHANMIQQYEKVSQFSMSARLYEHILRKS